MEHFEIGVFYSNIQKKQIDNDIQENFVIEVFVVFEIY